MVGAATCTHMQIDAICNSFFKIKNRKQNPTNELVESFD